MLNPMPLTQSLLADWLKDENGPHPASVSESADVFSRIISDWYASAAAGPFPVATAQANSGVLTNLASGALMVGNPTAAGALLATGTMVYMTGQAFGPGVSAPPIAHPLAVGIFGTAFTELDLDREARAAMMATAVFAMAITSIVTFPGPPFTAPVL
ncbi:hypothetical protein NBRC116594_09360 [Shimia sp. NS0008-38b]|uniref:hypothetical protein n=1 Tax=Shimia sp. NS0008-38b TaxID=3127653 RepID=UPI003106C94F